MSKRTPHPATSRRARLVHSLLDFFVPFWGSYGLAALLQSLYGSSHISLMQLPLLFLYPLALSLNSHSLPYLSVVLNLELPALTTRRSYQLIGYRTIAIALPLVGFIATATGTSSLLYVAILQLLNSIANLVVYLLVVFYIIFVPIGLYGYFFYQNNQKD